MISNDDLRDEIEAIGLESLLSQDDGLMDFEDDSMAALWADAASAVQSLKRYLDLDNMRRL